MSRAQRLAKVGMLPAAVLALSAGISPGTATAAPVDVPREPEPGTVIANEATTAMEIVEFDEEVANSNGYSIVDLSDGTLVSIATSKLEALDNPTDAQLRENASSVLPSASAGGGVTTNGVVYGNCGSSMIEFGINADNTWKITTGYNVRASVSYYDWNANIYTSGGSTIVGMGWEGGPTGTSWRGYEGAPPTLGPGTYTTMVTSGTAVLVDGAVCYSGHPTATATHP